MDTGPFSDKKLKLPPAETYEVGFAKPPLATRFKPGHSGNPKGRPRGRKSKLPGLAEERLKTLILQEAYRDVPIVERGRAKKVSMIEANIRALAVSGAKGNNRAANIFATAVLKIEAEQKQLASDFFGSAIDYKQKWGAEFERRKRLGLNLPDPVPHPDDLVLDRQHMKVHIRGPLTKEDQDLWEFGKAYTEVLKDGGVDLQEQLDLETDEARRGQLREEIKTNDGLIKQLQRLFGPPEIRRRSHIITELEDDFGLDLSEYQRAKAEDEESDTE